MISSLKSRFDFFNRRALFISAGRARVYHWNRGALEGIYTFDTSERGLALFEDYIGVNSEDPIYLLTDLQDEEFRLDTIPHVTGTDRKSLIDRKRSRLFRDIKYSYCEVQGRETDGRRDDRILLAALTEDEDLLPWLTRLESKRVPVAGIYSVATLTRGLLKTLGHGAGPGLVVSMQRHTGLRQSFFHNDKFRFSRLVKLPRYGTEPYAPIIAEEMGKVLRYLHSMRHINHDSLVQIYLLVDEQLQTELEHVCPDKAGVSYNRILLKDVAARLGLKTDFSEPFAESIFVYLLLKSRSKNVYAGETETRYHTLRRWRNILLGSSLFILLGAFIWSGLAFIEGITLQQQTLSAKARDGYYTQRYQMASERLPEIALEPEDLKTVVNLAESLAQYKATPLPVMQTLSDALQQFPGLQVNSIHWLASTDPNARPDKNPADTDIEDPLSKSDDYAYYQIAAVNGLVSPFDGDYRRAIDLVNRFAEMIRSRPGVYDVEILALPLDVSSRASLQGTGESVQDEAGYSLRIVLGIANEA